MTDNDPTEQSISQVFKLAAEQAVTAFHEELHKFDKPKKQKPKKPEWMRLN